jgi:hypothetical protein
LNPKKDFELIENDVETSHEEYEKRMDEVYELTNRILYHEEIHDEQAKNWRY